MPQTDHDCDPISCDSGPRVISEAIAKLAQAHNDLAVAIDELRQTSNRLADATKKGTWPKEGKDAEDQNQD